MFNLRNPGFVGILNNAFTLTYLTGSEITGTTVNNLSIPAANLTTAQAGDLILIHYTSFDNDSEQMGPVPSGFTDILTGNYNTATGWYQGYSNMYKVLTAADIASGITLQNATNATAFDELDVMYRIFRPSKPIVSVTAKINSTTTGVNHQNTTTVPTTQTINPVGETSSVIMSVTSRSVSSGAGDSAVSTYSTTITPSFSVPGWNGGTANNKLSTFYEIYNSSPFSHTATMTDSGTNELTSFYLTIS